MKTDESLYIRILLWAYKKSADGFSEQELLTENKITPGSVDYKLYLKLFKGGDNVSGNPSMIDQFDIKNDVGYWCLTEKGMSSAVDYLDLKETQKNSKQAFWIAISSIIISIFTAYASIKLGENQIDQSREQVQLQNAIWIYEQSRNDRLESRDNQWRKEDLQFQGRLPE